MSGSARTPSTGGSSIGRTQAPTNRPRTVDESEDEGDVPMRDAPAPKISVDAVESLKLRNPDPYGGDKKTLGAFLLQLRLYLKFNDDKFDDPDLEDERVFWAISYLRGEALGWIEPYINNYFTYTYEERMPITKHLFSHFDRFEKEIKKHFGPVDETQEAVRKLRALKQKGPARTYATEFQRLSIATSWNDEALTSEYYEGLKEEIKDEIARGGKPEDYQSMRNLSILIDNRTWERKQERHAAGAPREGSKKGWKHPNRDKPREANAASKEVNAMGRGPKKLSKSEKERYFREKLCFKCGKTGHMANFHKTGQKGRQLNLVSREIAMVDREEMGPTGYVAPRRHQFRTNTEEELEEQGISTQLEPPPAYSGHHSERSGSDSDESDAEERVPATELDEPVQTPSCYWDDRYPAAGELWEFQGVSEAGSEWITKLGKPTFISPHHTTGARPQEGIQYRVREKSDDQVTFEDPRGISVNEKIQTRRDNHIQRAYEAKKDVTHRVRMGSIWSPHKHLDRWAWKSQREPEHVLFERTSEYEPSHRGNYVAQYKDLRRIGFQRVTSPGQGQSFFASIVGGRELYYGDPRDTTNPTPRNVYEIVIEGESYRLWKEVASEAHFLAQRKDEEDIREREPHTLVEDNWTTKTRKWIHCIHGREVRELYATNGKGQLELEVTLRGKKIRALVDSGAGGNYLSPNALKQLNIPVEETTPYKLRGVDGNLLEYQDGVVNRCTTPTRLQTPEGHQADVQFDIAGIGRHQAILGMPWIREHNPIIDWNQGTLEFSRCRCEGSH